MTTDQYIRWCLEVGTQEYDGHLRELAIALQEQLGGGL